MIIIDDASGVNIANSVFDNNLYYRTAPVAPFGVFTSGGNFTFAQWQSVHGMDLNGLNQDPLFVGAPADLNVGSKVIASDSAPIEVGNALPLGKIPVGTQVHNIEIKQNKGGQIARGAGVLASVFGKDESCSLEKAGNG